jgi:hypothetical protein
MLFINMCSQSAKLELLTVSAVIIALTVISIELTLKWNAISDVYDIESTGQLIPFITGLVGLLKTMSQLEVQHINYVSS